MGNDVARNLVAQGKWEEAKQYGGIVCASRAAKNEDGIWEEYKDVDITDWNNRDWGNAASLIHYGAQFENRNTQREDLRKRLVRLAANQ